MKWISSRPGTIHLAGVARHAEVDAGQHLDGGGAVMVGHGPGQPATVLMAPSQQP